MEKNIEESKSMERSTLNMVTRNAFHRSYQKWKEETKYSSSIQVKFDNKNYQDIIAMGWDAVPHIIEVLRVRPDHLFLALEYITKVSPIKSEHIGNVRMMAHDWIEWYDNPPNRR
jgi:hypothetical protein